MTSPIFLLKVWETQLTGLFVVSCIHYAINLNHAEIETKAG